MASKKQKKKKQKRKAVAFREPCPGEEISEPAENPKVGGKVSSGKRATGDGEKQVARNRRGEQWNIIRKGTLEMKVFQVMLVVLALGAILQYPLWADITKGQYLELKEEYPAKLSEWEEKYDTEEEREEHAGEKPQEPRNLKFGEFLLYQALILVLQGAIFMFLAINVSRRTDLAGTPVLDRALTGKGSMADVRDLLKNGLPWGAAALAVLLLSTVTGEALGLSGETQIKEYPAWKSSLNFVNLAVNNQVLFVFLVISALVWLFARYRGRLKLEPHWAGIIAGTILAFGYFFMISSSSGDKVLVAMAGSSLFALSLVGMLGYLYWKKGLEYSLLAGVVALGTYPFLAALVT